MKFLGVVGSRSRNTVEDFKLVASKIWELWDEGYRILVSGGCLEGADRFAEFIAKRHPKKFGYIKHPAQWAIHGNGAGMMRNPLIVNDSDALLACFDGVSEGTKNSISLAERIGIPVFLV
jgi:hypothetical protein